MTHARHPGQSLASLFATPWVTTHRALCWLGGGVALLLCLAAPACSLFVPGRQGVQLGLTIYAFGAAYFWMCVMAGLVLVCMAARQLRLPGIVRVVAASVLLYAIATVALPVAMFAPMGGDAPTFALVAALAAAAGLAVALLPRYATMLIAFLPALAIGLRRALSIPFPGEPGFLAWGAVALVVLLVANLVRWRQLLLADATDETGLGGAMVMQYHRRGAIVGWGSMVRPDDAVAGRGGKDAARPLVRLDGVGPQSPVRALRVALGDGYAPLGLRGHWRRFVRRGLPLLLFIPLMAVMQAGEAHGQVLHKVMLGVGVSVMGWLGAFGGVVLMASGSLLPWTRWRRTKAELPLLALLPGLGDAGALRIDLLRAALARPLAVQALLLALVLAAVFAMHAGPQMLLFATLAQLGCAATIVALTLSVFGGLPLPGWGVGVMLGGMILLVIASTFVPMFATLARHPYPLGKGVGVGLLVGWSVAAAVLFWLGRHGWRGLQRRQHPFLMD